MPEDGKAEPEDKEIIPEGGKTGPECVKTAPEGGKKTLPEDVEEPRAPLGEILSKSGSAEPQNGPRAGITL